MREQHFGHNYKSLTSFVFFPGDSWSSVTVLATQEILFLLDEDYQWSKRCSRLAANEEAQTTSRQVTVREMQPISYVSSILLFSSDPYKVNILLYDEVCVFPNYTAQNRILLGQFYRLRKLAYSYV